MIGIKDLTGQKFGKLTVKSFVEKRKNNYMWLCLCDCGTEKVISRGDFKSGHTRSCGCYVKDKVALGIGYTHGYARRGKICGEYRSWQQMINRCTNPNSEYYHRYGGRGITVCDSWMEDFSNFIADMGDRPNAKMSIERIDNNKGYYKENCKWATAAEQNNNRCSGRKITIDGQTKSIKSWSAISPMSSRAIIGRLNRGWKPHDAVYFTSKQTHKYGRQPK